MLDRTEYLYGDIMLMDHAFKDHGRKKWETCKL